MPQSAKHSSASFAKGHFFPLGGHSKGKGGGEFLQFPNFFSTLPKTEKGEGEFRTDKPETRGFLFSSSLSLLWTDARVRGKVTRFEFRIKKFENMRETRLRYCTDFIIFRPRSPLQKKKPQLNMRSDGRGKIIAEVDESREKAQKRSPGPPL